MDIGREIRVQRVRRGLTQAEVAALAGLSARAVSRIEQTGRTNTDTLHRVCEAVGLEVVVRPVGGAQ